MLALEHPTPGEVPRDAAACRIDAWFRKKLLKRLMRSCAAWSSIRRAVAAGGTAQRLAVVLPPLPKPVRARRRTCPDCGGLALVAYPGNSQAVEECGKI